MDHQLLFAALFVLALIGHHLAIGAPLSDTNKQHHEPERHLAAGGETKSIQKDKQDATMSVHDIENILNNLDADTTLYLKENGKEIEIMPLQHEQSSSALPEQEGGELQRPDVQDVRHFRRSRRSTRGRRTRRSAALLLHATLRMCNLRPQKCKRMWFENDDIRISVRFVEE